MQVTAIWIPLPTARSGAPAPLGLSTKGGAQPLFDSRETAPLKRVVAWLRSRRAAPDPQAKGAAFAPSPLSTPAPPPTLGWRVIVSPPRGRPPEAMGEREAYLRPGTPVVHLLCGSGHASADSRGRLAPTSGRRAEHRPGTARLPRAGSGSASAGFSARACARVGFSGTQTGLLGQLGRNGYRARAPLPVLAGHCHVSERHRNLAALDRHLPF